MGCPIFVPECFKEIFVDLRAKIICSSLFQAQARKGHEISTLDFIL